MITLTIDGKKVEVEAGTTVLEAARAAGIYIPNLCYHPDLKPTGSCRLCVVEVDGRRGYPTSCTTQAQEGMVVSTNTPDVQELRKDLIWLLLSEHGVPVDKTSQFQEIIDWIGEKDLLPSFEKKVGALPVDSSEPLFIRDPNQCVLCGRCVQMCRDVRGVGAIGFIVRGINAQIGTSYGASMEDSACRFCGACVAVCPTGALREKNPCEGGEKALLPCKNTCPAEIDIPRYVNLAAQGRFQDALEVIREKVPFPHSLGLVCDHPCEGVCRRSELHEPVAIRAIKRFVAERDTGRWRDKMVIAPDTGKRIAVVGSGPAGLTAAWFLRLKGHAVTVFEALPEFGGMLRVGIPEYRLVSEVLDKEIGDIRTIGVDLKKDTPVESLDALFEEGYGTVFIAVGAHAGMSLGLPGEEDPRVLDGIEVLRDISLGKPVDVTGDVAVIGGGNVAMDVARCALRVGASSVTVVYRRTRAEMPAYEEEIVEALEEGVEIKYLTNPTRILPGDDKLTLECVCMELGEPDESGRRRPEPVEGSEFLLPVDRFLVAIGQQTAVPEGFGIETNRRGRVEVDGDTRASSRAGVFSGGDVQTGPASVIEAIQAGRLAASAMDRYLGGDGDIDQTLVPQEELSPYLGRDENFPHAERAEMPTLPVGQRLDPAFPEVECGLDEGTATAEANRCLRCQLRLGISDAYCPHDAKPDAE